MAVLRFILSIQIGFSTLTSMPITKDKFRYYYAALYSGAKIIETSKLIRGPNGILQNDEDKYLMVPCSLQDIWVEISLSEDISIDEFQVKQGEIYSSRFKEIHFFKSLDYHSNDWDLVGKFILDEYETTQKFKVSAN